MKKYKIINKGRFYRFIAFLIMIFTIIGIGLVDIAKTYADSFFIEEQYKEVYIETGDTIWAIAKEYMPEGKDIREVVYDIQKYNNIRNNNIQVGNIIKIPEFNR